MNVIASIMMGMEIKVQLTEGLIAVPVSEYLNLCKIDIYFDMV
jgi:hypothetical protein